MASSPRPVCRVGDSEIDQRSDSAPLPSGCEYDVFFSFRGPDTRKGFVDCLYNSMRDAGIRVFLDNVELPPGNKIMAKLVQGIEQSKIAIPILSKGYADSVSCLKELALIDGRRREEKQIVMPIFYDVSPHLVGNERRTGSYDKALRLHAERNDQRIKQWRDSLLAIKLIKGWELEKTANGHQGSLIKSVVTEVLRKLKTNHLPVTKYWVGVECHANALMALLDVGDGDVRMVGIHGISGVGKTTLAKYIYNKLLDGSEFEGCSSLSNIREKSLQLNGLEWLQSKLVADIRSCERRDLGSIDEGTNILMEKFRSKKVLILLDDVGHTEQLNVLVAERDWFGPGSRIIVTTTDARILREAPQVNSSYELGAMEDDDALELFNKHAFRADPLADPSTANLKPLAKKIVKATGGIPLALEVVGSFLYGRSKEQWEATLKKLRVKPDKKVLDKLKISYEGLENEYQQIFLDIACFFIGVDFRIAAHMWEDCKFFPTVAIEVLQLRCLTKIGEDKKLWMHDSLRDLGREIVRQEYVSSPRKRSRSWCSEEAIKLLQPKANVEELEAISIQNEPSGKVYSSFEGKQFERMTNLRFLQVNYANLKGDFQHLTELRWLRAQNSSVKLINSLPSKKLKILDISWSDVTEGWSGWSSIKEPIELKVLDLTGCHQLRHTPDFSLFPSLERLILEDCKRLKDVHKSIVDLQNLSSLNMKNCQSITELPRRLGSMKKLEELIIDGISVSKLPDSTCSLRNLKKLSANDCHGLQSLPSSIGQLSLLVELRLSRTGIATLPDSVGNLNNMEVLNINSSKLFHLPRGLANLGKLKVLDASMCENLTGDASMLGRLCSLKVLRLYGTNVSSIPDTINELSHLQTRHLPRQSKLPSPLKLPVSLVSVTMTCQSEEAVPDLSVLINLKELVLSIGAKKGSPEPSPSTRCDRECQFPGSLRKLNIFNSSFKITLSNLQKLSELSLERCYRLKDIPGLGHLVVLKSLKVSFCSWITNLNGLENLKSLTVLLVSSCQRLEKLPDLSKLKKLSVINVRECRNLLEISGKGNLYALTDLDISHCDSLKTLDLSNWKLLRSLSADGCKNLKALKGLGELKELLFLSISECTGLERLSNLSKLVKLRYFNIKGCKKISEVHGLLELDKLKHIIVSHRVTLAKFQDAQEANDAKREVRWSNTGCTVQTRKNNLVILPHVAARGHQTVLPDTGHCDHQAVRSVPASFCQATLHGQELVQVVSRDSL